MNKQANGTKLLLSSIFIGVALIFAQGTILQQFLLNIGIGESKIMLYSSLIQISQCVAYLFCMVFSDNVKRVKLTLSVCTCLFLVFLIVLLILNNISSEKNVDVIFLVIAVSGIFVYLPIGLKNVLDYKFPLQVLGVNAYQKFISINGFLIGIITILVTLSLPLMANLMPYKAMMNVLFSFAILITVCSVLFYTSIITDKNVEQQTSKERVKIKDALNIFYPLMPFDLLRGLANGVMGSVLVFAKRFDIISESTSVYYPVVFYIGSLGASLFILFTPKLSNRILAFITIVSGAVLLPFALLIKGNLWAFLVVALIVEFVVNVQASEVPILISKVIPTKDMGTYTARRMLVFIGGNALSSFIVSLLIEGEYAYITVVVCCVLHAVYGLGYLLFGKKKA